MAEGGNPEVLARARAGDLAGAIAAGEAAIARGEADPGLAMFVGVLCCRQGDIARGVPHLEHALAQAPDQPAPRVELARALLSLGRADEARTLVAGRGDAATPVGRELLRIAAQADLRLGAGEAARDAFAALTTADPGDFESWDGLGAAHLQLGAWNSALAAATRAVALRPDTAAFLLNLARARLATRDVTGARQAATRAVARAPDDPVAGLELARAWLGDRHFHEAAAALSEAAALAGDDGDLGAAIGDTQVEARAFGAAEASYRRVLAAVPGHAGAWAGLLRVLERTNRTAEVLRLASEAGASLPVERTALVRARALRTEGQPEAAVTALADASLPEDAAAREQLLGEIADRRGDADAAFGHFSRAAEAVRARAGGATDTAGNYLARWAALGRVVTPGWRAGWRERPRADDGLRDPVFIFGFPRSGTTLLDTLLGGHPEVAVLEEDPVIDRLAEEFGAIERLPTLDAREIARFRARYFAEAAKYAGPIGNRLIVDKHPLGIGSTPTLHRLFPQARFVFMLRHTLDVVLSCYMMSPDMNADVGDFATLEGTARLYDAVLTFWRRCTEVLPIAALEVRYEALVADPDAVLRQVAEFVEVAWSPAMLEHQAAVSARGAITSPSYAQVAEPIYARASGAGGATGITSFRSRRWCVRNSSGLARRSTERALQPPLCDLKS